MPRLIASLPILAVLLLAQTTAAQTQPRTAAVAAEPAAGTQVALVDIGHIFKHHPTYKAARDALKAKGTKLQNAALDQRKHLTEEGQRLQQFKPGTPEFKQLEADLTQEASNFQVKNELTRKNLLEEEAKLYYETYKEVEDAVVAVSKQYNIQLVLRFDRDKMDPTDLDSIRRGLMSNIVYQNGIDITDHVMRTLTPVASRQPNSLR